MGGGEAASLVDSALLLRSRAPELALLLADRAVAAAGSDRAAALPADHLAVASLNRLGRGAEAVTRALAAMHDTGPSAEPGDLTQQLLVELAHCANDLGEHAVALACLRPVLATRDAPAGLRAAALLPAGEALAALGHPDVARAALAEAERLHHRDFAGMPDAGLLARAEVRAASAMGYRRLGAPVEAEADAREGLRLLGELTDPDIDSGQVGSRLALELALVLLDRGDGDGALRAAKPLLDRPVRAAAAGSVGWLRLALATRVHLPAARHAPALTLLADAVEGAQRHGLDAVLMESLEGLSHVHEVRGELADALHCVREAHAAERRRRTLVERAREPLLAEFVPDRRESAVLPGQLAELIGDGSGAGWVPGTGLLTGGAFRRALEAAVDVAGGAPLSQVLVQVVPSPQQAGCDDRSAGQLLADVTARLQGAAPEAAGLGRLGVDRIGVLLPGCTRPEARSWVDRLRVTTDTLPVVLRVGVAQYLPGSGPGELLAEAERSLRSGASDPPDAFGPASAEPEVAEPEIPEPAMPAPADWIVEDLDVAELVADMPAREPPLGAHPVIDAPAFDAPAFDAPVIEAPVVEESVVAEPETEGRAEQLPEEATAEPAARSRLRRQNTAPVSVADLVSPGTLGGGRAGRRRAEDRHQEEPATDWRTTEWGTADPGTTDPAPGAGDLEEPTPAVGAPASGSATGSPDDLPDRAGNDEDGHRIDRYRSPDRDDAATGPPPPPRPLAWSSGDSDREPGLGDLLAEALAAFQEGRRPQLVTPDPASRQSRADQLPAAEPPVMSVEPTAPGTPAAPGAGDAPAEDGEAPLRDHPDDEVQWTPVWDVARAAMTRATGSEPLGIPSAEAAFAEALTDPLPRVPRDPDDAPWPPGGGPDREPPDDGGALHGSAARNGGFHGAHRAAGEPSWRPPSTEWRSTSGP